MKVGDLVRWTDTNEVWHLLNYDDIELTNHRQRGVIVDKNPKYFFVLWENGEYNANFMADLEVISES